MKKAMLCITFLFILSSAAIFSQESFEEFISYENGQKTVLGFQIYGDDLDKALVKSLKTGHTLELKKGPGTSTAPENGRQKAWIPESSSGMTAL